MVVLKKTVTIVPNCDASSLETHMKGVCEVFVLFCLTSVITVHVLLETVAWKAYITTEIKCITISCFQCIIFI